jgi:hypothetical protein
VRGEVQAKRRRGRMDIGDGKATAATGGGAGDCRRGRGVECQQVVRGVVEMAVDNCPHCCYCALPRPPRHHIAPPGSPATAASAADHHCTGVAQEEEQWVPCAQRERERGEDG